MMERKQTKRKNRILPKADLQTLTSDIASLRGRVQKIGADLTTLYKCLRSIGPVDSTTEWLLRSYVESLLHSFRNRSFLFPSKFYQNFILFWKVYHFNFVNKKSFSYSRGCKTITSKTFPPLYLPKF